MTDFVIVGQGLAANVLMHSFRRHQLSFCTIGNGDLSNCSKIAAGIWNPVVFKRLTKSWLADELIPVLNEFYLDCGHVLGKKIITHRPIIKTFVEEQEKKFWQKKSGTELKGFLDPEVHIHIPEQLSHCLIANGYGRVEQCGNLDTEEFLSATAAFFSEHMIHETFDHSQLKILPDKVIYKTFEARNIIFCEGYLVKNNPFFNWIPLKPAKGEILTIVSNALKLNDTILNKNGFLMDIHSGIYKVGATYEWQELDETPTAKAMAELQLKLTQMVNCNYSVTKHEAGIRPSSIDRRPIIGEHPKHRHLHVFNGLGTKGVMLAPFFAKNFVNFYLQKESLRPEVDVKRFYNLYAG